LLVLILLILLILLLLPQPARVHIRRVRAWHELDRVPRGLDFGSERVEDVEGAIFTLSGI
jgi:hypothetical protein